MTRAIPTTTGCPTCEIDGFSRNHYFNGKLLVERDFTDEQRYYIDKARYHNQRLHGWGVVCGLKVTEHPNDACRDRFVCVEPGSAVDCCGHDVVVPEKDCIDILALEPLKTLKARNESAPGIIHICLRYKECPTEEIPVLYDDCGCDETQCAPNRILESYEIGVLIGGQPKAPPFHSPQFEQNDAINVAHAMRVVYHAGKERLYVLTADAPGVIYQVDTATHLLLASHTLPAKGRALAVSADGTRVYVAADPIQPATDLQLHVLDTAPGLPAIQAAPLKIPNSASKDVVLAVANGQLLTLVTNSGDVLQWGTDIDTQAAPAAPNVVKNLGAGFTSMALNEDGTVAYAATAANVIQALTIASATSAAVNGVPAGAQISSLLAMKSSGADILAVGNQNGNKLEIIKVGAAVPLVGTVQLEHPPIALAASPGGHWVYVLERDSAAKKSYIQAVDIHASLILSPRPATPKFEVSDPAQELVATENGDQLFVPFTGDTTQPVAGGVLIVDVSEDACSEILWRHLEGCPHCDIPNCIILATIKDYQIGTKITNSRIDNRTDRKVLASTETLQELIECVMEHGNGGGAGPQGPPGQNGAGIDNVIANIIPCEQQPAQPTLQIINGVRTLTLEIPRGCDGASAPPPPPVKLTHICATSWKHGGEVKQHDLEQLLIAFDAEVDGAHLDNNSIRVFLATKEDHHEGPATCWCEIPLKPIRGIQYTDPCKFKDLVAGGQHINAVQFRMAWMPPAGTVCRVLVNGDFILDANQKAVDADHIRPWLPARKTGDGVEGGTFESWFTIVQ